MDQGGRVYSNFWDQVTPENAGKWSSTEPSQDNMNWGTLDSIHDYAMQKGIIFKQHTFVWGSQYPDWIERVDQNTQRAEVEEWIRLFCERYGDDARLIDVVNEPPPHTTPPYTAALGGSGASGWDWVLQSFKWAHQYCPNAILILNDYNNIEWSDQTQNFINIANAVKNAGGPIHALGAQAHGLSTNVSTNTMKNLLTKMHNDTGLPVYITEYDINLNDDQQQLGKFQEHFDFFLQTDWIPGITIWGWIYGATWLDHTGLIRDGSPRPAMTWLMQELGRPAP